MTIALRERALHVAHVHLEVGGHVARHFVVEPGGVRGHGRSGVRHRGEVLVDHLHQLEGVLGDVAVLRHHHRHRIAHVAHPVRGDGRLLGALEPLHDPGTHGNGLEPRHVRGREHPHDPGQSQRRGRVNGRQPGVGAGAAEDGGVHHAGPPDVAHVLADAPQERHVFPALHARTDVGHDRSSTSHAGFGVRVHPSGAKSDVVNYRAGNGARKMPNKRVVVGRAGRVTPDQAKRRAQDHKGVRAGSGVLRRGVGQGTDGSAIRVGNGPSAVQAGRNLPAEMAVLFNGDWP